MYRPVEQSYHTEVPKRRQSGSSTAKPTRKLAKWKKLVLIAFVGYLLIIGQGIYNQEKTIAQKQQEVDLLEQEFRTVKQENEQLQSRADRLHEQDYIAEIARQNYYLSKPGEVLFIVPPER